MTEQKPQWTTYSAVLGAVLARHRAELGFHQRAMADNLSISQATWSRIERGESPISAGQLYEVSQYLKLRPSQLVAEADTITHNLQRQGVIIYHQKPEQPSGMGLALAGAGGFALAMALLKKDDGDD